MKNKYYMLIIMVVICTASCTNNSPEKHTDSVEIISLSASTKSVIAEKANEFGFELYQDIVAEGPKENIVISPLSCAYAMSLSSLGAVNKTYDEIVSSLGFTAVSKQEIGSYYRELTSNLNSSDNSVSFKSANSIWINENFTVYPSYIDASSEYYDALARVVDFGSPGTVKEINAWISDKTKGKIDNMLDDISGLMAIINALYFQSPWTYKTNKENIVFNDINGKESSQDAISTLSYDYYKGNCYQYVSLAFGSNGKYIFETVIPDKGTDIRAINISDIKEARFNAQANTDENRKFIMPFIDIKYKTNLIPALKHMGIKKAFSEDAEFNDISKGQIFISKVLQQSTLIINDKGGEATAATVIIFDGANPNNKQEVIAADRPFIFSIYEKTTGTILFIGQKNK